MEVAPKTIRIFRTLEGHCPFLEWLRAMSDERGAAKVKARLARIRMGNFGLARSLGGGLHELKIDHGPGYRVYFGAKGIDVVILLCGGDKRTQNEDIKKARKFWAQCQGEKTHVDH